jgi:hypothetical protein
LLLTARYPKVAGFFAMQKKSLSKYFAVSKKVLTFATSNFIWAGDARFEGFFYACTFLRKNYL